MTSLNDMSPSDGEVIKRRRASVARSISRRHGRERRFQAFGLLAVGISICLVLILFGSILQRGLPAFWQATVTAEVYFDPEVIDLPPRPLPDITLTPEENQQALTAWQSQATMVNWNRIIEDTLLQHLPPEAEENRRAVRGLITSGERFALRDRVLEDPAIIGQTLELRMLTDANVDVWLKGNINRDLPNNQQQLGPEQRAWADALYEEGVIEMRFSWGLFLNTDSRSSLASAGLAGAFMGSLFMMLIVMILAVPVGVASAIYLEEFAPKNRLTDLIEININNLAAVPSIVFGLLGAAVFINWFRLPLSAPLVGGLVLTLMTLPTIIIATRSTLRAIPPSIRQAALGLGASRVQTVFHHVLPLAIPGILTGSIIGVAQALGETAPLLLIGMNAFVSSVPGTPLEQSTALPVQIYLWQGNELRNFFEARTSAAIIVLLALMITLNAFAIWLRKRFERRW